MRQVVVVVACLFALSGCKKNPPARAVEPPTVEEAEAFAKDFATKLAPCDADAIDRAVDMDLLVSRAVAGRPELGTAGIKRGLGGLGKMLCQQLTAQEATVTYLRTPEVGGVPRPLLRLISGSGVNYYQLELDRQHGTTRLVDFYIFMSGENISATLGSMIDTLGRSGMMSAPQMTQLRQRMNAREWKEAQAVLEALPAKVRATKAIRLAELRVASELGDEPYLESLNAYTKAFPNDPSLALVAIDRATLREEYDVALRYMTELETRLGGDPYIDVIRAGTLQLAGKIDEAIIAAKRATTSEPTLQEAWWQLLTLQAAGKRHADAIATLEVLRDKFDADVTTDTLAGDDRFVDLVDSPEYTTWASTPMDAEP